MFEYRKLRVYHAAQQLLAELVVLKQRIAPGHSGLVRQLFDAAESISLNICEGYGDGRPAKMANYFRIGAGSASECSGAIESLITKRAVPKRHTYKSIDLCLCVHRMLISLAEYYEDPGRTE